MENDFDVKCILCDICLSNNSKLEHLKKHSDILGVAYSDLLNIIDVIFPKVKHIDKCLRCSKPLKPENYGVSAYSVCYDPQWKTNIWGGDTHEIIGYFCNECGDIFMKRGNFEK